MRRRDRLPPRRPYGLPDPTRASTDRSSSDARLHHRLRTSERRHFEDKDDSADPIQRLIRQPNTMHGSRWRCVIAWGRGYLHELAELHAHADAGFIPDIPVIPMIETLP